MVRSVRATDSLPKYIYRKCHCGDILQGLDFGGISMWCPNIVLSVTCVAVGATVVVAVAADAAPASIVRAELAVRPVIRPRKVAWLRWRISDSVQLIDSVQWAEKTGVDEYNLHQDPSTHGTIYQLYFASLGSINENNRKNTEANNKKLHIDTNTHEPYTQKMSVLKAI